jgi:hypothetical protein
MNKEVTTREQAAHQTWMEKVLAETEAELLMGRMLQAFEVWTKANYSMRSSVRYIALS